MINTVVNLTKDFGDTVWLYVIFIYNVGGWRVSVQGTW